MAARKVDAATELLLKRIELAGRQGEWLPSERELAVSMGISRTTIRQATKALLEDGALTRLDNGRLAVTGRSENDARTLQIGFLMPTSFSFDAAMWRQGVESAVEGFSAKLRVASFEHWGDPAIGNALDICDGLFLLSAVEPIPKLVLSRLQQSKCRVVVLDQDETDAGLPSVLLFPLAEEVRLLQHLVDLGHRHIDCINAQSSDRVIEQRIETWRTFITSRGLGGQLWSQPIFSPIAGAYRMVRDLLSEGRPLGTGQFCTTGPAAIGAMRALHESGLEIGRDISVCSINDEGFGRYLLKSLTALESPPRMRFLRPAVEWMLSDTPWSGPLLVQPTAVNLFEGESTGPAPTHASTVVVPTAIR